MQDSKSPPPSLSFADADAPLSCRDWLIDKALPLWSDAGYDSKRRLYHERMTWDSQPITMSALRLMVQARQISTYCRAKIDGFCDFSALALQCLEGIEKRYHRRDDMPGWIFSLAPDDTPADTKRDLYAHAFILYAYGWAIRLTDSAHYKNIARQTAADIERVFATSNGGYFDTVPTSDRLRRQNPHMHLFEAFLLLFEATGDDYYLSKLQALKNLSCNLFFDKNSGLLLEFFDHDWKPEKSSGFNRVEPGHLFEWSWLFNEYNRITSPASGEAQQISEIAERLFQIGRLKGCDPETGFAYDAITDATEVLERSIRLWPQTELIRLMHCRNDVESRDGAARTSFAHSFLRRFTPQSLNGGWIDHFDELGKPLVSYMPASSLYHLYSAARELC